MFVLQVIFGVLLVYGILSLIQDISNEITYKKISHNMKTIIFAKDLEKNIDQFIIELYNIKKINCYKQIIVIDLEEEDNINMIKNRLLNSEINVDILNYKDGEKYINNLFENENVSFL